MMMKMTPFFQLLLVPMILTPTTDGFQSHIRQDSFKSLARVPVNAYGSRPRYYSSTRLFLFDRKKDNNNEKGESDEGGEVTRKSSIPFFGRFREKIRESQQTSASDSKPGSDSTSLSSSTATVTAPAPPKKPEPVEDTPESLRAKAERARLEAQKMDAELTLAKIEKLEKKLTKSQAKGESVDEIQWQIDDLVAKLNGEPPKPRQSPTGKEKGLEQDVMTVSSSESSTTETASSSSSSPQAAESESPSDSETPSEKSSFSSDFIAARENEVVDIKKSANRDKFIKDMITMDYLDVDDGVEREAMDTFPGFILKTYAAGYEMEIPEDAKDIDKDELFRRVQMARSGDFSYSNRPAPIHTQEQIDMKIRELNPIADGTNATMEAIKVLDFEYYRYPDTMSPKSMKNILPKFLRSVVDENEGVQIDLQDAFVEGLKDGFDERMEQMISGNVTSMAVDSAIERLYPKCTRKDGEGPTEANVDALVQRILPAVKFTSTSKPQKVKGGYVIKGSHKYESGDELIDAIEKELKENNFEEKFTVLYAPDDFTKVSDIGFRIIKDGEEGKDFFDMMGEIEEASLEPIEPILYVTGKDITRSSNRLGLTLTSMLGIATCWYASLYPFLLNDNIARRVDAEVSLIDAGMQPDLSWLTEQTLPLFFTFLGLQFVHEVAHWAVATSKGVKLSVPVFVPSLITGVTSTVTTFKSLPKNRQDMFDISAAGPLFGLSVSTLVLALGAKLTLISDQSMLPALPLDILRQSTLGGGIIEAIIPGALYVPEGAPTNGILIGLHPVAIAGYISLIVNALSLLPIGTTDGGRFTMAAFGREAKLDVGSNAIFILLLLGFFGSDLFLFYFSFIIAFQTGNEVPARNEVDEPEESRALVAILCYVLAILSLTSFQ